MVASALGASDAALLVRPGVPRVHIAIRVNGVQLLLDTVAAAFPPDGAGSPPMLRLVASVEDPCVLRLIAQRAGPDVESVTILETEPLSPEGRFSFALASCQVAADLFIVQTLPTADPAAVPLDHFQMWHTLAVLHDPGGPFEPQLRAVDLALWSDARSKFLRSCPQGSVS